MEKREELYRGKAKSVYKTDDENRLILLFRNDTSAFDGKRIEQLDRKGMVNNKFNAFIMQKLEEAGVPTHFDKLLGDNECLVKKLDMIPVECIVRGYITGSGWEGYQKDGKVCGIQLPEGLKECQKLPHPIFTPSTKAPVGEHDQNISMEEGVEWVEKFFPGKGKEYMEKLSELTLALYNKCADYALERGIIIADTKFEFGLDKEGNIVLGDEMLTPDNSRFWPAKGYEAGHGQPSYDKQFVRDYLKAHPGDTVPQEIIDKTIGIYKEAYELLTGEKF